MAPTPGPGGTTPRTPRTPHTPKTPTVAAANDDDEEDHDDGFALFESMLFNRDLCLSVQHVIETHLTLAVSLVVAFGRERVTKPNALKIISLAMNFLSNQILRIQMWDEEDDDVNVSETIATEEVVAENDEEGKLETTKRRSKSRRRRPSFSSSLHSPSSPSTLERVLGLIQMLGQTCCSASKSQHDKKQGSGTGRGEAKAAAAVASSGRLGGSSRQISISTMIDLVKKFIPKSQQQEVMYKLVAKALPSVEGAMPTTDPISKAFKTQSSTKSERKRTRKFGGGLTSTRSLDPWLIQEGIYGFGDIPTLDRAP